MEAVLTSIESCEAMKVVKGKLLASLENQPALLDVMTKDKFGAYRWMIPVIVTDEELDTLKLTCSAMTRPAYESTCDNAAKTFQFVSNTEILGNDTTDCLQVKEAINAVIPDMRFLYNYRLTSYTAGLDLFQKIMAMKGMMNPVLLVGHSLHPALVEYLKGVEMIQTNVQCLTDKVWATQNVKNLRELENLYRGSF